MNAKREAALAALREQAERARDAYFEALLKFCSSDAGQRATVADTALDDAIRVAALGRAMTEAKAALDKATKVEP